MPQRHKEIAYRRGHFSGRWQVFVWGGAWWGNL